MRERGSKDADERIAEWLRGRVVVMGMGNPMRGDDAAGSLVAQRIEESPGVSAIDAEVVPENYLSLVVDRRPDTVVLIDSMELGSAPGSVAFLDRDQIAGYGPTTHRVPMSLLMSVLERETGARVFAIGIQPAHTEFLNPVSDAVLASIDEIAGMLNHALAGNRRPANGVAADSWEGGMSA